MALAVALLDAETRASAVRPLLRIEK